MCQLFWHLEVSTIAGFLQEINSWIEEEQWKVTPAETTALMGAHTLVMTYACTTTGQAPDGSATPDLGDRTCGGAGGRQRMFTWDNSFFM